MMLNFRLMTMIFALVAVCYGFSSPAFAETYYVSPKGSDSESGSKASPWCSLQFAESKMSNGDILILRGGTYKEAVRIKTPNVTFKNYPGETPIIDGEFTRPGKSKALIWMAADGITLDGLTVTRSNNVGIAERSTNGTVKNCIITYSYNNNIKIGMVRQNGYNVTENCTALYGNYCRDLGLCQAWNNIGANVGLTGNHNTIKNSTVAYSATSGIEGYQDNYTVVENNVVYGHRLNQIHFARSNYAKVRYNLCYGVERLDGNDKNGYGPGVSLCTELWYNASNWDTGHEVYGNLIANTKFGIIISYSKGKNTNYPNNKISNCLIYNNSIVEPHIEGLGKHLGKAVNIKGGAHLGTGHVFKNNLIWQTDGNIRCGSVDPSKVKIGHNLWNKAPASTCQHSTDPTYDAGYPTLSIEEYLAKSSGWTNLEENSLKGNEFRLLPSAIYAIDKGTSTPVNSSTFESNFLNLASVDFPNREFNYLNQNNNGKKWEIGADVYSQQGPDIPTCILTLVNSNTNHDLYELEGGDTVNLDNTGRDLNIRADFNSTPSFVRFFLDGSLVQTERKAPYSIGGDTAGDYYSWTPDVGTHTLRVSAYNASEDAIAKRSISFTVTED